MTLGFLLAVYLFCLRAEMVHKLFVFTIVFIYGFLMTETVSYAGTRFHARYMYSTVVLICHVVLNGILFYPMLQLLSRARSAFRSNIDIGIWKKITLIPGLFVLWLLLFRELPYSAGVPADHVLNLFTKAMEILTLVICFAILSTLEAVQRLTKERILLKTAVENYRVMAKAADKEREARHEFRHHIAALSILLQNGDYEGAGSYLEKVSGIDIKADAGLYTPHALLNAMLSEYRKRAAEAEIRVDYVILVPGPLPMDDMELCQFVSNLLDNALEANQRMDIPKRWLSLTIRQTGNFLYFLCENPCDPEALSPVNNRYGTSKPDKTVHGYGISIMERIAEKYNGVFHTSVRDAVFSAAANLCLPVSGTRAGEE